MDLPLDLLADVAAKVSEPLMNDSSISGIDLGVDVVGVLFIRWKLMELGREIAALRSDLYQANGYGRRSSDNNR